MVKSNNGAKIFLMGYQNIKKNIYTATTAATPNFQLVLRSINTYIYIKPSFNLYIYNAFFRRRGVA